MVTCSNILLFINLFLIIYLIFGDSFKMLLATCLWLPLIIIYGTIIIVDEAIVGKAITEFLGTFLFPGGGGIMWNPFFTKGLFFIFAGSFAIFFYILGKKLLLFIPFSLQSGPQKKKTLIWGAVTRIILFVTINYFLIVMLAALREPFGIENGLLGGLFGVR